MKENYEWTQQISKGLKDFVPSNNKVVCSNHFQYRKPAFALSKPTLYHVQSDQRKSSPRKRRIRNKEAAIASQVKVPNIQEVRIQCTMTNPLAYSSLTFAVLSSNHDVSMFIGLPSASAFECVFSFLLKKASIMHYWKGSKDAKKDTSSPHVNSQQRALTLKQQFLLSMMKLKMGLFLFDLAFRFGVCESTASSAFTTWVKLMAKELDWLISWSDRKIIQRDLSSMFRKYYLKCRVIIDCTELFVETPSSLEVAAMCWSNYKQHYTAKFLIGITPNGHISFVSETYGGRASDVFIAENSKFCNKLQPNDQVMADHGFKINNLSAFHQCSLKIPPSKHRNLQMSASDVQETSIIANVRIYVEQAIKSIKDFYILKKELPVSLLPLLDDIVVVFSAFCNLKKHLTQDI